MVHSTNVLTYGLSTNNQKKDDFLRLIVFTIVKITSTDKEIGIPTYLLVPFLRIEYVEFNNLTTIRFWQEQKTLFP
jgi:hypothetical protein